MKTNYFETIKQGIPHIENFYNKNQFLITLGDDLFLQSYQSIVACYDAKRLFLFPDWDYSNTTRKHLYLFIEEYCNNNYGLQYGLKSAKNKRQFILEMIKKGFIVLVEDEKNADE